MERFAEFCKSIGAFMLLLTAVIFTLSVPLAIIDHRLGEYYPVLHDALKCAFVSCGTSLFIGTVLEITGVKISEKQR